MDANILAAVVFILFAVVMGFQSIGLGLGTFNDPGPGFLPLFSTVCIGALSAAHLVVQVVNHKSAQKLTFKFGPSWPKAFFLIFLSLIYVFLLWGRLGYILGTALWLVAVFRIGGIQSWKKILTMALITVLSSYLLLEKVARCVLPTGPLGLWGL